MDEEVVDAHRDQVDPDGVVAAREERHPQPEPTPSVDATNGLAVTPGARKSPRRRRCPRDLRPVGRAGPRRPGRFLAGADVDPGGAVGSPRTGRRGEGGSLDVEESELRGVLLREPDLAGAEARVAEAFAVAADRLQHPAEREVAGESAPMPPDLLDAWLEPINSLRVGVSIP